MNLPDLERLATDWRDTPCPICGGPVLYAMETNEQACKDPSCVAAHGFNFDRGGIESLRCAKAKIDALIARVRELEEALGEALAMIFDYDGGYTADQKIAALRSLLAPGERGE